MASLTPQSTLASFFLQDHRDCDASWATVEKALNQGDAETGRSAWTEFEAAMIRHFTMEEEVLFPAFEQATGMSQGPTAVMRMEHEQMKGLMKQISAALDANDFDEAMDQGDTLLMVIQQHNVKEEGVLYPMAENTLGGKWDEIMSQLENY
jgi:iron-sulfur cluster repair protein YtfE (RIC family)